MHVLLSGIVGSTAYGLDHAGSDIDRLGVFAAPTERLHGLHPPRESHVTTAPDSTLHEAGKAVRLILSCNPTASEILWLPEELYEVRTPLGEELIALRAALLSRKAVRNAYLGYATQQFRKLRNRGSAGPRAAKHARHLLRLLHQAVELHGTGLMPIRLPDPERLRAEALAVAADPGRAEHRLAEAEAILDGPGVLPEAPDAAAAEAWLLRVRRTFYPGPEQPVRAEAGTGAGTGTGTGTG